MRRIIKYNYISDKASYIMAKMDELIEEREKLIKNINDIKLYYQGQASSVIIAKYLERVKIIDGYIDNVSRYAKYFRWISSEYKESRTSAVQSIMQEVEEIEKQQEVIDNE